jgi:hypothetical protein
VAGFSIGDLGSPLRKRKIKPGKLIGCPAFAAFYGEVISTRPVHGLLAEGITSLIIKTHHSGFLKKRACFECRNPHETQRFQAFSGTHLKNERL